MRLSNIKKVETHCPDKHVLQEAQRILGGGWATSDRIAKVGRTQRPFLIDLGVLSELRPLDEGEDNSLLLPDQGGANAIERKQIGRLEFRLVVTRGAVAGRGGGAFGHG